MTKCCNQLDVCYDTCGANKYRCDAKFRWCLHSICSDLKRSLGFVSNVEVACDSLADTVFNTVWTLGCRPFMNSQRAACICAEEEKVELWERGDPFLVLSDTTARSLWDDSAADVSHPCFQKFGYHKAREGKPYSTAEKWVPSLEENWKKAMEWFEDYSSF